jgi:hypothetical protein
MQGAAEAKYSKRHRRESAERTRPVWLGKPRTMRGLATRPPPEARPARARKFRSAQSARRNLRASRGWPSSGLGYILENFPTKGFARSSLERESDLIKFAIYADKVKLGQTSADVAATPVGYFFSIMASKIAAWGRSYQSVTDNLLLPSVDLPSLDRHSTCSLIVRGLGPFPADTSAFCANLAARNRNPKFVELPNDDANINLTSCLLLLEFGSTAIFLTGDSENVSLEKLRVGDFLRNIKTGVVNFLLKVPHHGSPTSPATVFFSRELQEKTSRRMAVISPYHRHGHPSPSVLDRYFAAKYETFVTTDQPS